MCSSCGMCSRPLPASAPPSNHGRRVDPEVRNASSTTSRSARLGSNEMAINGPMGLSQAIFQTGRKGAQISRYKGLGEMNPEQLWETTLDPTQRVLLQVSIEQEEDADNAFSTLMGEAVDQRREFIQKNALRVANLDV